MIPHKFSLMKTIFVSKSNYMAKIIHCLLHLNFENQNALQDSYVALASMNKTH